MAGVFSARNSLAIELGVRTTGMTTGVGDTLLLSSQTRADALSQPAAPLSSEFSLNHALAPQSAELFLNHALAPLPVRLALFPAGPSASRGAAARLKQCPLLCPTL